MSRQASCQKNQPLLCRTAPNRSSGAGREFHRGGLAPRTRRFGRAVFRPDRWFAGTAARCNRRRRGPTARGERQVEMLATGHDLNASSRDSLMSGAAELRVGFELAKALGNISVEKAPITSIRGD